MGGGDNLRDLHLLCKFAFMSIKSVLQGFNMHGMLIRPWADSPSVACNLTSE